jgi:glycerol-3-phosphate acyltransferase PlsX
VIRSDGLPPGPASGGGESSRSHEATTVRIAVDLLGGDDAPAVVVDGALQALASDPTLQLLLVGPHEVAEQVRSRHRAVSTASDGSSDDDRLRVCVVDRGVSMSDPVARGLDGATTIGAALRELAAGRVDGFVSAGASGAIVAAAVVAAGRLAGVRRPALAAMLPTAGGPLVLLDVGAGMRVHPADLLTHAVLGASYARLVFGVPVPRVGLLSVGSEPGKGDQSRRSVDAALRTQPPPGAVYVGPVEGGDVVTGGRADVVVTDGFTGNVLLKGIEAALRLTAAGSGESTTATVPQAAALLGVAGTVVVCHGAADAAAIASGIWLAHRLVTERMVDRLHPTSDSSQVAA